jgi:hypothetical protein
VDTWIYEALQYSTVDTWIYEALQYSNVDTWIYEALQYSNVDTWIYEALQNLTPLRSFKYYLPSKHSSSKWCLGLKNSG